jgi:hypothetical protein
VCPPPDECHWKNALGQADVDAWIGATEACEQPWHVKFAGGQEGAIQMCPRRAPRNWSISCRGPAPPGNDGLVRR